MKRFEKIVLCLMVIPVLVFSLETLAIDQKMDISMVVPAFQGEKLSGIAVKEYKSDQKYYNKSFKKQNSSTQGTVDIGLIELYSPNPDAGSLNYHSAWYPREEGGTEPFYGNHFNYAGGQFKLTLRNSVWNFSTYDAEGTWYVSYQ